MGCLAVGLAAVLALAIPASIAPASLVGAYVVLAILTVLAVAGVEFAWQRRGRLSPELGRRPRTALLRLAVLVLGYAVVVTIIHVAAT